MEKVYPDTPKCCHCPPPFSHLIRILDKFKLAPIALWILHYIWLIGLYLSRGTIWVKVVDVDKANAFSLQSFHQTWKGSISICKFSYSKDIKRKESRKGRGLLSSNWVLLSIEKEVQLDFMQTAGLKNVKSGRQLPMQWYKMI